MSHTKSRLLAAAALATLLAASPAPRVTVNDIDNRIADIEFFRVGATVTICQITLDNGYSVRGESACVSPENYNQELGEHFAEMQAREKLWPVMGLLLAEELFRSQDKQPAANDTSEDGERSESDDAYASAKSEAAADESSEAEKQENPAQFATQAA